MDIKVMYKKSKKPVILKTIPQIMISVEGQGDPNTNPEFQKHIGLLYKLSYAFRMSYKKVPIEGFEIYKIGPLEGIWTTIDERDFNGEKDRLKYKIFITQPKFITKEVFEHYISKLSVDNSDFLNLKYEILDEGLCGQIMHVGSFDSEDVSIDILKDFISKSNYEIVLESHHEIYMSDFRRSKEENLKTIIRYKLRELN